MITQKGTVSKIKVLKLDESPLVRFSLDDVSCLIRVHSLNFLWEVAEGSKVVVGGSYNTRNQFVVRKYCVITNLPVAR
mgnify:CR=1 FL=1